MTKHLRNRRQLRRAVLATVIVVLGVGVWQGVAGATAASKTEVIQGHNANCGHPSGKGPIGAATFSREGTELFIDVVLTDASKNTDYIVQLWKANSNGGCERLEIDMGELATDGAGQAEGVFSALVGPKKGNFFVDITTGEIVEFPGLRGPQSSIFDNDSLIAHI